MFLKINVAIKLNTNNKKIVFYFSFIFITDKNSTKLNLPLFLMSKQLNKKIRSFSLKC